MIEVQGLNITGNHLGLFDNRNESSFESPPISLLLPKLSLEKLAFLISQFDLVIGSDTGPTHIAWALNIPSITLYGPTPGYRNTFVTEFNKIIDRKRNLPLALVFDDVLGS